MHGGPDESDLILVWWSSAAMRALRVRRARAAGEDEWSGTRRRKFWVSAFAALGLVSKQSLCALRLDAMHWRDGTDSRHGHWGRDKYTQSVQ